MTEFNSLEIEGPFKHAPERLIEAQQQLPMLGDYVPVGVHDMKFTYQAPDVRLVDGNAVSLSIDRPFGFLQMPDNTDRAFLSQLVDKITIAHSDSYAKSWTASFETVCPLTKQDERLFSLGVRAFGIYAGIRLSRMDKSRQQKDKR